MNKIKQLFTKTWEKIKQAGRWTKRKWKQVIIVVFGATALAVTIPNLVSEDISMEKVSQKYEQSIEIKENYQINNGQLTREFGDINEPKVKIGKEGSKDFEPNIKLSRWDEVYFEIVPDLSGVATKDKDVVFEGNKIRLTTPKIDYEFFDYEEGYKFVWYLKEKPTTNKVSFAINSESLDFHYQSELTQAQKDRGMRRPENVVGSYAVYYRDCPLNYVGGKLYRAGKAFHIFRPRLKDSNGWEVWGDLHIENGIYEITIPQDFYNNAVYPIRSNDTFGYLTVGSSSTAEQTIDAGKYAGSAGTATTVHLAFSNNHDQTIGTYGGLYNSSSGLVAYTGSVSIPGNDSGHFFTYDITDTAITAQDYYITSGRESAGQYGLEFKQDDLGVKLEYYDWESGSSWNSWSATAMFEWYEWGNVSPSAYVTYTTGGAAARRIIIIQ